MENHYPDIEMTTHSMRPTRRIPNDFEQQDVIDFEQQDVILSYS